MPAIIIAIIVALSGGVSVAANAAVPGDILHPVKTEVNERVMAGLAFSAEAKAIVEARLAERRVEEAEKLAARGELKADVAAKLSERFEARAEKLNAIIDRLEAEGKTEAAANLTAALEATLKAHDQILTRLEERIVQPRVQERAEKAAKARARIEEKVRTEAETGKDVQAAAEGKMGAATNKIAEVKGFIDRAEARFGAEAVIEAKAKFRMAEQAFAEGKAKLEAKAYGAAFAAFQKAMRIAQEAKALVDIGVRLRFDVRGEGNKTR